MLYHYSDKIVIFFEDDETWMIDEIKRISEHLIQDGCNKKNTESLFCLVKQYVKEENISLLYGKMFCKIIAYISRDRYKIISTDPFCLEKYDR